MDDQHVRASSAKCGGSSSESNMNIDPKQRFQEISEAYSRLVSAIDQQKRTKANSSSSSGDGSEMETGEASLKGFSISSQKVPSKKKRHQSKQQSSEGTGPSVSSNSMSDGTSFPPLPFPPELAAHYLSSAAAAAAKESAGGNGNSAANSARGRVFGPILPPKSGENHDGPPPNFDFGAFARSCGGVDLSENGDNDPSASYSEAEIKALMSMFVEFMGMFSEQNDNGDPSSMPSISRETIMKMNAALAASNSASKMTTDNFDASKVHQPDSSFPVFSMLFGFPRPSTPSEEFNLTPESIAKAWKNELGKESRATNSRSYSIISNDADWADYYEDDDDDDEDDGYDDEDDIDDDIDDVLPTILSAQQRTNFQSHNHDANTNESTTSSNQPHWIMNKSENTNNSSSSPTTNSQIFSVSTNIKTNTNKRENIPQDKPRNLSLADQQFVGSKGTRSAVTGSFIGKPLPVIKCYHSRVSGNISLQKNAGDKRNHDENDAHDSFGNTNDQEQTNDTGNDDNAATEKDDEERARKAAKKREKKNRRKEKAKREAAMRAAITAQRRREVRITSWKSRVAAACSNGEASKLDSLFSECPFKNATKKNGRSQSIEISENAKDHNNDGNCALSNDGENYLDMENCDDDIIQHMEWLLQACVPKSNLKGTQNERDARQKLAIFIMSMCVEVIFQPFRNGRNALHVACQLGDVQFVKSVVEHVTGANNEKTSRNSNSKTEEERTSLTLYLDWLCEESGWSPLHYATASGSLDVIETLLAGGSSVNILTDPSLTCKVNNFKGVSAAELAQNIHSGSWKTQIVCHGNALKDAVSESNPLETIISRLKDIELNGYSPPYRKSTHMEKQSDFSNGITSNKKSNKEKISDDLNVKKSAQVNKSNVASDPSTETSKKKKRNRKKKGQAQIQCNSPENNSKDEKAKNESSHNDVDPLVSALIGMGFTHEQIDAAVKACGGLVRATADDLVAWIFENEASQNKTESQVTQGERLHTRKDDNFEVKVGESKMKATDDTPKPVVVKEPHIQRNVAHIKAQHLQRLNAQAKKEAIEAAAREKESHAAAQRLAAKREEQRRINREWNNREQVRQKEEAQAKVLEEIERRKKLEQERLKSEAIKLASDRVNHGSLVDGLTLQNNIAGFGRMNASQTPSHTMLQANTLESTSQPQFHSGNLHFQPVVQYLGNDSAHGVENSFNVNSDINHVSNSINNLSINSDQNQLQGKVVNTNGGDQQNKFNNFSSSEFKPVNDAVIPDSNTVPLFMNDSSTQGPNVVDPQRLTPNQKTNSPKIEVNAYEFPELGKDKEVKPQKTNILKPKPVPTGNDESTVSSSGSGKKPIRGKHRHKLPKNANTVSGMNGVSNGVAPPGFRPSGFITKPRSTPLKATSTDNKYLPEPNTTGEIRATAKAFVPSNFKLTSKNERKYHGTVPPPGLDAPLFGSTVNPSSSPPDSHFSTPSLTAFNSTLPPSSSSNTTETSSTTVLPPVNSVINSSQSPLPTKKDPSHNQIASPMSSLLASVSSSLLPPTSSPVLSSTSSMTGGGTNVDESVLFNNKGLDSNKVSIINPNVQENEKTILPSAVPNPNIWGGGPSGITGYSPLNTFSFNDGNQQRSGNDENKNLPSGNFFLGGTGSGLGSIW